MSREMKDSGVEWIGEIPTHWRVSKILNFLRSPITDGPHETPEYVSDGVPFISVNSIDDYGNIDRESANKISLEDAQEYNKKTQLSKGDILFTKSATIGKTAIVDKVDFMVWSPIAVIKTNNKLYNNYLKYILDLNKFIQYVSNLGTKNTQVNVGMRTLEKAQIVVPPYKSQVKINEFLDEKVSQVNQIIENTRDSIEELKSYKQSLITETVTKGLDPDVPMKDSWIEWIGDIPQNWKTAKIKYIGNAKNGLTYKPIDLVDAGQGTLILRSGNIKDGNLVSNNDYYVTSKIVSEDFMLKEGDILICSRNGSKDLIGKNALITENHKYTFGAFMMRFRPYGKVNSDYIYYVLNSEVFNYYLGSFLTSTISQLTLSNFNNMNIVLPTSKCEQNKIVNYLDNRTHQIDNLISKKEKMIKELESYKQSLIYEYVTGKKEVE